VTTPDGVTHDLQPTIDRIRSGKLFTFRHDGAIYYNNEGKLPNLSNGVYKEYVHPTPGLTRGAGPMRVITGGSKMWFTPDHYGTMIQIKF
jgi:filamentous hemagglutinin